MQVTVNLLLVPAREGRAAQYVAGVIKTLQGDGLETHLHAHGINISGEWDQVMASIKKIVDGSHQRGLERLFTFLSIETRTGEHPSLENKMRAVQAHLA